MLLKFLAAVVLVLGLVSAEDPYRYFDWNVTYGDIYPLGGARQQVFNFYIHIYSLISCDHDILDHVFQLDKMFMFLYD